MKTEWFLYMQSSPCSDIHHSIKLTADYLHFLISYYVEGSQILSYGEYDPYKIPFIFGNLVTRVGNFHVLYKAVASIFLVASENI